MRQEINMARKINRNRKQAGLPPGTMVYIGDHGDGSSNTRLIRYSASGAVETHPERIDCMTLRDSASVSWLQVMGLSDTTAIRSVSECIGLHPLQMEDIVNTDHRAKIEISESLLFAIVKHCSRVNGEIHIEHLAIALTSEGVVSFSERHPEIFEPVVQRLLSTSSRMLAKGPDYLFYTLLDSIVDHNVVLMELLDDEVTELDERLLRSSDADVLRDIHNLRRDTLLLRKAVLPLRDIVMELLRTETDLISTETRVFIQDVLDHTAQILDTLEHDLALLGSLIDLHMSIESKRMNEIMKLLTMIATIFIPLTFIAGVYGMNFAHMPELHTSWGYPASLSLMAGVAVVMLVYFRKKKWL